MLPVNYGKAVDIIRHDFIYYLTESNVLRKWCMRLRKAKEREFNMRTVLYIRRKALQPPPISAAFMVYLRARPPNELKSLNISF